MMSIFRTQVCVLFLVSRGIEHVQLQSNSDLIDAFDCLGTVINTYKKLSMECSNNIDASCSHGEIICVRTARSCNSRWSKPVKVSVSLTILSSNFMNDSKLMPRWCKCGELFFNCSIESEFLIKNLVHEDTCSTSTSISTTTSTTQEITSSVVSATSGPGNLTNSTFISTPNPDFLKDSNPVETVTSYGAIIGALIGGVVLGAVLMFLTSLILRRKSKPSNSRQNKKNLKTVRHNPAYECSKGIPEKTTNPSGDIYTQIMDQNCQNISAVKPSVSYENTPVAVKDIDTIYNHLHESKDIDRTDYYDHAQMIPSVPPPTEEYQTIQTSSCSNAYTEVVGEGLRKSANHSDPIQDEYFILNKC
ncbi:uncharacterized protein LOC130047848 isoform X2 [Ostrea edulis]|uniref:uncharacterized protein LOC130047848 isoform X2 n=1 Tax=Ostrea edulis TaxID=37623 RepID=UPI0024AEE0BD|nr:uncharacterized protein LOC130047848 isoform X2 [Ostrea edulis]